MYTLRRALCPLLSPQCKVLWVAGMVQDLERRKGKDALALVLVELGTRVLDVEKAALELNLA